MQNGKSFNLYPENRELLNMIREFGSMLTKCAPRLDDKNPDYLAFAKAAEELERERKDEVMFHARMISKCARQPEPKTKNKKSHIASKKKEPLITPKDIMNAVLWYELGLAIKNFSEHPSKKVATIVVDGNQNMIAYGFNKVPSQIFRRSEHYLPGERSNYIICAERNCLLNIAQNGGSALTDEEINLFNSKPKENSNEKDIEIVQSLTSSLVAIGYRAPLPQNSIVISTAHPCAICAPPLVAHKPKIIFYGNGNKNHKRNGTLDVAAETFGNAKIAAFNINGLCYG